VGCVDNAATRALLHVWLSSHEDAVHVDAGNAGVELPGAEVIYRSDRVRIRDSG
jgi:hypothetical protein